ncbi:MAG: sugar ABC transporter substrate-binding protein [Treponemataceae bacterium]
MKKILVFAAVLCALAASSVWLGCGANKKEPASAPAKKIELKIAWWGSQARHEGTIKVIELYEKLNPNVHIVYEFAGWVDYWTKLTTMAAGGQLPDVIQQDYARLAEWQSRNLLYPLDDFISKKIINTDDIAPALLASGKLGGKLYAINLGSNSQTMVLDVDAFKKAGIPLPSQKWSWADFEKIAMDIKGKLGIYGGPVGLDNEQLWKSLYLGLGGWSYSADGKSLGYTDDAPFVAYLKMVLRLNKAGAIASKQEQISAYADANNPELQPIVSGKGAMAYMWSNQPFALVKAAGEGRNFTLTHLPRAVKDGAASNYLKASMYFSVTTQSKNPEEAAKFIDFFTNSVEANKILMAERGVPISAKIRKELSPLLPKISQEVFAFIERVSLDNSPTPPPDPAHASELIDNVFKPEVAEKVLFRVATPEDAVKTLRTQAGVILSKN